MKATDSAGHVDMRHVVLGVQVSCQGCGSTLIATNKYPTVDKESSANRISVLNYPGDNDQLQASNGTLIIDVEPTHGTLEIDPNTFGCVLYTPNPGYRGLDEFRYHWDYEKLDYWTMQPFGTASTNVSREQIQVGNWVDLTPETTYEPGKSLLAVGGSETTTLTLQNPRADGVSTTGFWDLGFNRNEIRVYDANGSEIFPGYPFFGSVGSTSVETVGYEKQITLTVVGVAAGEAELDAFWTIWASPIGQNNQIWYSPWHWSNHQRVDFNVVGIDIDTDSNLDGKIEHGTDDPIEDIPPGRPIRVNWDDDNDNGVVDSQESPVPGENDLAQAIVTLQATDEALSQLTNCTISLETIGTTGVKFWDSPYKDHEVGTWDLNDPAVRAMPWRTGVSIWIEVTDETNLPSTFFVKAVLSQTGGITASDKIACQAVGTWTRDNWTMTNAHATAASKLDTLAQLAWDITGVPADAQYLKHTGPIQAGTVINVVPLLEILETRLRGNVVTAANAYKDAGFGHGSDNLPNYQPGNMKEAEVNSIFFGPPLNPTPEYDCINMATIEMARGVIMTLLPGEFDKLGLTPAKMLGNDYWLYTHELPLYGLKPGDFTKFYNNENYRAMHPIGYWEYEAVIKTGADWYNGWTNRGNVTHTYGGWLSALAAAYNEGLWSWQQITVADVPGYTGDAWVIDVPKLAMEIFDLRVREKT